MEATIFLPIPVVKPQWKTSQNYKTKIVKFCGINQLSLKKNFQIFCSCLGSGYNLGFSSYGFHKTWPPIEWGVLCIQGRTLIVIDTNFKNLEIYCLGELHRYTVSGKILFINQTKQINSLNYFIVPRCRIPYQRTRTLDTSKLFRPIIVRKANLSAQQVLVDFA